MAAILKKLFNSKTEVAPKSEDKKKAEEGKIGSEGELLKSLSLKGHTNYVTSVALIRIIHVI